MVYHPPPISSHDAKRREPNASLKTVEDKICTLQSEKRIRDEQAVFLSKYAGTIDTDKYDGNSMLEFLNSYLERKCSIHQDTETLEAQIKDLEKEAKELRKTLFKDSAGVKRRVKVSVVSLAANDGRTRLILSYSM